MCFKYLGRVECYVVLWCEWMKIFGRYLHPEGGNCQKSYFEVFSRAGSDWPLCKISTLTATPFMFFVHKYLIFDKYLTEIFSLNLWSVFQLSQTASDGFDWNWVKSGPLLFVIFQILNAMDRPIVQWGVGILYIYSEENPSLCLWLNLPSSGRTRVSLSFRSFCQRMVTGQRPSGFDLASGSHQFFPTPNGFIRIYRCPCRACQQKET